MRFYIISKEKCIVKIDGALSGVADGNLSYFDHCGHNLLLEFIPSDANYNSMSIFYDSPKSGYFGGITSLPTEDGYLLIPLITARQAAKAGKIYTQSFCDGQIGVSIIADPYYKIIVSTATDCYFTEVKYYSDNAAITSKLIKDLLIVKITSKHTYLYVFSISKKIALRYAEEISDVEYSDCIEIKKQPVGVTGCEITEKYSITDFTLTDKTYTHKRSVYGISREVIPCAFLEELQRGGDYTEYLSSSLKVDNRLIAEYFGNFLFFIPYIINEEIYCALVYPDRVECVLFTLSHDNMIADFAYV